MARVTTFLCDRCGQEMEERAGSLPVITIKTDQGDVLLHHAGINDVCSKCMKTVTNYVRKAYLIPEEKVEEVPETSSTERQLQEAV